MTVKGSPSVCDVQPSLTVLPTALQLSLQLSRQLYCLLTVLQLS